MQTDPKSVKQFKLVTGEDVICEIIDDEDESDLYVRNVLKMVQVEKNDGAYTVFRPFMMFQESPTQIILLRTDKIVSAAVPLSLLYNQYMTALNEFEAEESEHRLSDAELEEFLDDDPEPDDFDDLEEGTTTVH